MNTILSNLLATSVVASTILVAPIAANADDQNYYDNRLALSFAPEATETDDPFSQLDLHGDYDDAHELNDAWLGMPVRSTEGKIIGYVDDAFLDDEGYLTELLVSLNGSSITVFVDQKHVEYTDVAVLVDLPLTTLASLAGNISPSVE
ncbi:MAG: PRC-barrel domain-containing protein [Rhizobiaceae bacterium]